MSYIWNPIPTPVFTQSGQFASGAAAYFFIAGTTTPKIVYQDAAFTIPHTSPVIASQNGVFLPVYVPYGAYRIRVVDQAAALIFDADNIDNLAPPASGGGIVVTTDQIFQTGDTIWIDRTGLRNGWVRRNLKTIGAAASAATELASATTQNLFLYLYQNFTDALAPVSGGRTGNAAADFAANKTIGIPTMQGRLMGGLDDMGGTAAGILQAILTCSTNGTTTVTMSTAASLSSIAVGMNAIVAGVAVGTIVSMSNSQAETTCSTNGSTTVIVPSVTGLVPSQNVLLTGVANGTISTISSVQTIATTCSTVDGTAYVIVASAAGLILGMNVSVGGTPIGVITAINGTTIRLSGNVAGTGAGIAFSATYFNIVLSSAAAGTATFIRFQAGFPLVVLSGVAAGTASGVAFRASSFTDAQVAASKGGGMVVKATADQLPDHTHVVTDLTHDHTTGPFANLALQAGAANSYSRGAGTLNSSAALTGIVNRNTGGGNPMAILPPIALGTFFIKL